MRAARISAVWILLASFFLLALKESRYATPAFGQAAAPAAGPSVPVITLPAAPGQPQPFATIGALPQLLAAPHPVLSPTPTPSATQVFRCACNGPGFATSWIGQVQAASLLIAQQQAPTSCTRYLIAANAESPSIAPPGSLISQITQPVSRVPGTLYSAPPGSLPVTIQVPPPVINHPPASAIRQQVIASECSRCSCD